MDFGSTFGSGSVDMQYAHLSFRYSMGFEMMKKNLTEIVIALLAEAATRMDPILQLVA
jgi:hypothetical protein